MPILTLSTDFGTKDHFVAALKGSLIQAIPDIKLVDITHEIAPFNVVEAAYIIRNAYASFPKKSIHLVGVDAEFQPGKQHVVVVLDDHFFICSDNGVLTWLAQEIAAEKMIAITAFEELKNSVFPVRDVFTKVAAHIAGGGTLDAMGHRIDRLRDLKIPTPIVGKDQIQGRVIYVDHFGNAVTNITEKLIRGVGRSRKLEIHARSCTFDRIYNRYGDIERLESHSDGLSDGKKLALYNSSGLLELSIYRSNSATVGGAATLFGLQYRDSVGIQFFD
ncbi:MAG: SAM-dependent chlorinase/fluorinase [Flavobacteriales bacterium]